MNRTNVRAWAAVVVGTVAAVEEAVAEADIRHRKDRRPPTMLEYSKAANQAGMHVLECSYTFDL